MPKHCKFGNSVCLRFGGGNSITRKNENTACVLIIVTAENCWFRKKTLFFCIVTSMTGRHAAFLFLKKNMNYQFSNVFTFGETRLKEMPT